MTIVDLRRQQKWARLRRMTWGEIRTRGSQEILKRLDLAKYLAGLGYHGPGLNPRSPADTKLFFGMDANEAAHRAKLVRTHLPQDADAIIDEADNICRHQFRLLGYEKLDFGATIDWHFDPVHGKRSPLEPWFTLNFLDFRAVGDHKIVWELNRHQHLVTLAKAWLLSGKPAYANEVAAQFYAWQKANPYPLGINWASTLEVAFRSMSWLWVRNLLSGSADLPGAFHNDVLLALQSHGRYIERYLSTYFSPNTHLIGEAVALFFLGTLCPEISAAARWRAHGWKILLEESEGQVRPDGVYFEQSLHYHVYALDFFLHARILATESGTAVPEQFDAVLKKMLDVVDVLSEAGSPEGFGDDDGGRVFNPRRNEVECMTDPLALGSIVYDGLYAGAGLTEESIWLFGDRAIQGLGKTHPPATATSKAFVDGGIYLINDQTTSGDAESHREQMVIDAGPHGNGRSGHGHADALSVRMSLDGRRWLIDPGTYRYMSEGGERDRFRGTAAHNTLRVDGLDQAVADGPFAWSSIPNVKTEKWVNGRTFDFFCGSHDGYGRLADPVLHRRFVVHIKGGLWLVRDVAEGRASHRLESFWHFAPDIQLSQKRGMVLAESLPTEKNPRNTALALLMDCESAWTVEVTEDFVSTAYGAKQVGPVMRASAQVTLPEDCGVLLLPITKGFEAGTFAAIGENSVDGVRGYRYQAQQNTEFIFFARANAPWKCGYWTSDAELLYCKLENGRLAHVIMVGGSFVEWSGKRFVSRPSRTESFEWMARTGKENAISSELALEDSVISDFEVFDSVS